jgi:FMN-dependent oxidoreductase (nitrilotriacetate monooxygenase family)
MPRNDKMVLAAFMQASNVSTYAGSWLYPSNDPDYLSVDFYVDLARQLERGGFDFVFFDDRLAMPGIYGNDVATTVETGARPVKLDLITILGAMAAHTKRLGLAATYSTTYYAPYHVARAFATLDHLSAGRAAWNIVTSVNSNEAQNFGIDQHLEHDQRYERAEEFMQVCTGLWDTWDEDAVIYDRAAGRFADPEKVRELNFEGEWLRSRGPLTVPHPPQGYPLLLQAGDSPRGRAFAAKWADVIFTTGFGLEKAKESYARHKEGVAAAGRRPEDVKVIPAVCPVVGETEEIAKEKERYLAELVDLRASLVLLSEVTDVDFAGLDLDAPITEETLAQIPGSRGAIQGLAKWIGGDGKQVTLRDLASRRATLNAMTTFVGTGPQVADQMEEWFANYGCDGFSLMTTHMPGTFEEFSRMVVPELRRRGLLEEDPDASGGGTLRDRLGLPRRSAGTRAGMPA